MLSFEFQRRRKGDLLIIYNLRHILWAGTAGWWYLIRACIYSSKEAEINKYRLRSTLLAIEDGLVESWTEGRGVQTVV